LYRTGEDWPRRPLAGSERSRLSDPSWVVNQGRDVAEGGGSDLLLVRPDALGVTGR
jgi:hypothetical protein